MKIEHTFAYPADPDTVVTMLADARFQERKAQACGAVRYDVDVQDDGGAPTTRVTRTIAITAVPEAFARFTRESVDVREVIRWDAPNGGRRTGRVELDFVGQPMALRGTITLEPALDGSAGRLAGELKCSVPFLGGKAEKALAPQVVRQFDTEVATGTAWLVGER